MNYQKRFLFTLSKGNIFLFLLFMFTVGFSLGTLTLTGPARWVSTFFRSSPSLMEYENLAIKVIIILLLISTAIISVWFVRIIQNSFVRFPRIVLPLITIILSSASLLYWLNPPSAGIENYLDADIFTQKGSFTFGPYPADDDLVKLKEQGYTAIIPLLHPGVVPFEPKLLADVKRYGNQVGIEIISLPMLPWVSENEDVLVKIKDLAMNGTGKYYVHCYLGKDRVNIVKTLIEKYAVTKKVSSSSRRNIYNKKKFERGEILYLKDSVFVTPYPTDVEFNSYFFSGFIQQVVSTLDRNNIENIEWIEKEEKLMKMFEMSYLNFPLNERSKNSEIIKLVDIVKELPKPLIIHSFNTRSKDIKAFEDLYNKSFDD
jgi:hypothetical protein